jgi:hypothetical protein
MTLLIDSIVIITIITITIVVMSSSSAAEPVRGAALRATVARCQAALYNFDKLKPNGQPRQSVPWELKQAKPE